MSQIFRCKQFEIHQEKTAMKVGTDGVLLGAWCSVEDEPKSILDVGSGTGLIALMMAQRSVAETIDAVELEESAYEQTVENFERSNWADRLFCYHSSFQDFSKEMAADGEQYDLIISNPPFYTAAFKTDNESRNKARFTTSLSFEDLIEGVHGLLSPKGRFVAIIPYHEEQNFVELTSKLQWFLSRVCRVRGAKNTPIKRSMLEFTLSATKTNEEELTIEHSRHNYTNEYRQLTQEFYLNM